jgi:RHS repeat-associated protein
VNGFAATTDRLGSARSGISYYPWGEEKTSPPTQDGQVKFGTYFRDMPGQDYADQRYYNQNPGRFYTPDPAGRNAVDSKNPTSWNMYAYAGDDPVNSFDPRGTDPCDASSTAFYVDGTYYGSVIPAGCEYGGLAGYFPDIGTVVYSAAAAAVAAAQAAAQAAASAPDCFPSLYYAFNLDYSQLLYQNGTQSTQDHIIQRHMNGTTAGTSQYYATQFFQVTNLNALTFLAGAETYDPNRNTIVFTWTAPQLPGVHTWIGTTASGAETSTNRLVVKTDCKTVITSYPIPGTD